LLDVGQHVPGGIASDSNAGRKINIYPSWRVPITGSVNTFPAIEHIGAPKAVQDIVASQARDCVGITCADEAITALGSVDYGHVFSPSHA
jgi:hypothetical protein